MRVVQINSKMPEESLIPLGTLVIYTGGLHYTPVTGGLHYTPVYDSSMTKMIGSIKFNDIAMVVGQSYNDRYINVLTTDGINGWILCYQLTVVD